MSQGFINPTSPSLSALGITATAAQLNLLTGATHTLVNRATVTNGAYAAGSTITPMDNTTPQNTEGDQYMTITYQPVAATNIVEVEVTAFLSCAAANYITGAIFQDSNANALACGLEYIGNMALLSFKYTGVVGTISPTVFNFRMGLASTGTIHFNSDNSGSSYLNGLIASRIDVKEYTS